MRRALTRLIALWPLLLAVGWFVSSARLAGHLHSIHERATHLDDARGDWGGECELCRGSATTAIGGVPSATVAPSVSPLIAAVAAPSSPPRAFAERYPPLAARPPPAAA